MADSKEMNEISGTYAPDELTALRFSDPGGIRPDAQSGTYDGASDIPSDITPDARSTDAADTPAFEQASEPAPVPSTAPAPASEPMPAQPAAAVSDAAAASVYDQAPSSAPEAASGQTPHVAASAPSRTEMPRAAEAPQNNAYSTGKTTAKTSDTKKKKFSVREWVPGPNVPNQLTIARICMIPLYVIFILWVPKPAGDILAMIIFIIASLTDTADGYIARRYNYISTFGKFMDPLADKLLVCSAMICLIDLGRIDSWIVIIIIAREFIISGFRLVAVEKGVVIAANIWGKVKTVIQMLMVILMTANFQGFLGTLAQIFMWFALALTIISLATYLLQNRHVFQDNK